MVSDKHASPRTQRISNVAPKYSSHHVIDCGQVVYSKDYGIHKFHIIVSRENMIFVKKIIVKVYIYMRTCVLMYICICSCMCIFIYMCVEYVCMYVSILTTTAFIFQVLEYFSENLGIT